MALLGCGSSTSSPPARRTCSSTLQTIGMVRAVCDSITCDCVCKCHHHHINIIQWNLSMTLWDLISLVLITEMSSIQRSFNTLQYYTGTQNCVLITEVSSIQRSFSTLQYYTGTQNGVLIMEVSSIQRSFSTLQYYTGTQKGVLVIEVSTFQRFVIERFHCTGKLHLTNRLLCREPSGWWVVVSRLPILWF